MKVVVADANLLPLRDLLVEALPPGTELAVHPVFDEAALIAELRDADVFVGSTFTAAMGAAAVKLRLVHAAGAGTDAVDRSGLRPDVACANTFHHEGSIAEYVAMALPLIGRGILAQDRRLRSGVWHSSVHDPALDQPSTLAGKTVGLVGFGHIGKEIWRLLGAFGMRGIAVAGTRRQDAREAGLEWISTPARLPELLAEADAVVLSAPLTEQTRGMIGTEQLRAMKRSAVLVNVGRGPLVDERALYEALRDGAIAGAAIDVWYSYPSGGSDRAQPSRLPFRALDNVLMTPHISAVTTDTFRGRIRDIAENISRLAAGEPLKNVVTNR